MPALATTKRGRRSKQEIMDDIKKISDRNEAALPKKSNKIVDVVPTSYVPAIPITLPNIILNLKCTLKDLETTNTNLLIPHSSNAAFGELLVPIHTHVPETAELELPNDVPKMPPPQTTVITTVDDMRNQQKLDSISRIIKQKLRELSHNLHHNHAKSSSSCFWCTCAFDHTPVFLPKTFSASSKPQKYEVYDCFCSPECAAAHLMREPIDSTTKMERYYLLNNLYKDVYGYATSIKCAPDPHYLLDKFMGNLTIEEYRRLFTSERVVLILDKPLSRVMPELHEDNDGLILERKAETANVSLGSKYKVQMATGK